jgi:hypothetical protein
LKSESVPSPQSLIEKIKALPAERLDEVEDFVDFIASRAQERSLAPLPRPAQPFSPKSGAIPTTTSTMGFEFGDVVLVPSSSAPAPITPPDSTSW